jgi:hypothetical protein
MSSSNIQDQEGNIVPPRIGFVLVQSVDQTSHGYDMTVLTMQDENFLLAKQGLCKNEAWWDLEAIGGDIFFVFDTAAVGTNTIDDTVTNAAGTAWSNAKNTNNLTNGFPPGGSATAFPCARIASGTIRPVRVDRMNDKTLILKCASGNTATLRMTPSSQSLPGANPGS